MKISVDFLSLSNEPQNFKIEAPYLAHKLQCSEQRRDLIFLKGSYHANFLKDFFFFFGNSFIFYYMSELHRLQP